MSAFQRRAVLVPIGRAILWGFAALAVAACISAPAVAPPIDWQVVSVVDLDGTATASLAVPVSFHPSDHPPAGLDNRADAGTHEGLTLQFEGPENPDSQLMPGEDLRAILARRLDFGGNEVGTYTDVVLQAGPAVRMDRVDQRGEWTFRVVCYAISMRDGTAFLMFDGSPETYAGHELEISQIAAYLMNA
jgi:hypothetical protein